MPKINTNIRLRKPVFHDILMGLMLLLASRSSVLGMFPFGIAFFAACFDKSVSYLALFIISLGLILSGASAYLMKYLVAALLYCFFSHLYKNKTVKTDSVICACSVFLGGAIHHFCFKGGFSGLLLSLIEGLICGIIHIIFARAAAFMTYRTSRTGIARDELISVALSTGILITGLSGVELPMGITLSGIAAIYVVMSIAYHCNLSAAGSAGLGVGFVCSMSTSGSIASGGFYGICALCGSMLKGFGKYGAAVGFLGGAAAALIYAEFGGGLDIVPFDVVIGAVCFTLTPEKIHSEIGSFFAKTLRAEGVDTGERIRGFLSERLMKMSEAFSALEKAFINLSEKRIKNASAEAVDLFDETAQRVCRGCSTAVHCWERDWGGTYKRLLMLLDAVEKNEDIPKCVSEQCIRSSAFVNEFMHVYELYREKELYRGEAVQSRDLSALLYHDVSDIFAKLAESAQNKITFRTDYEDEITAELDKQGIILFEISVIEINETAIEVYLGLSSGAEVDVLEEVIKDVTGSDTELDSERDGIARFVTKTKYSIETGACTVPCEGCDVCGDRVEIFETNEHMAYIIISDGMGCGYDARNESEGMVKLLKEFILSGFDAETAIRTVNSSLCLQTEREHTASVDMLCINRINGIAKLFKIGCAETVIKHGDKFETIFPLSPPAGIIDDLKTAPQTIRIHNGDAIIMASDGITQCGGIFGEWVRSEYDENEDAEEIAGKIVNKAITKWNGAAFDDLSAVVVRIK